MIEDYAHAVGLGLTKAGESLVLIGETTGHLGQSAYLREIHDREDGAPPPVDLAEERRNGDFVRGQILSGAVSACHDLSSGGLLVAIAEMALAGGVGAAVTPPELAGMPLYAWLYGEDQARYVVTTDAPDAIINAAGAAGVQAVLIGETGGDAVTVSGGGSVSLERLSSAHENWMPDYMASA